MNKEYNQPRFLVIEELLSDLDNNMQEIKKYINRLQGDNYKCFFIYAYTLFEGAIWQLAKSVLYAFPESLYNNSRQEDDREKNVTIASSCLSNIDVLENVIENSLKKIGKGNLFEYLSDIIKYINYKKVKISKDNLLKISKMRNSIVHNNSLKKKSNYNRTSVPEHVSYTVQDVKVNFNVFIQVLEEFRNETIEKFSNYTMLSLLRDSWYYTVGKTFNFDYYISISKIDGKFVVRINFENLEKAYKVLSSSERTMLILWIQQYSGMVNDKYTRFEDMNSIARLDVERLNYFIKLFNRFPYLMDGQDYEVFHKEINTQ